MNRSRTQLLLSIIHILVVALAIGTTLTLLSGPLYAQKTEQAFHRNRLLVLPQRPSPIRATPDPIPPHNPALVSSSEASQPLQDLSSAATKSANREKEGEKRREMVNKKSVTKGAQAVDRGWTPYDMAIVFNIDPEIGGIVWNEGADGAWVPFYGRLGVGVGFSFFYYFVELNAVATLGMNWGVGLQGVFNEHTSGLWAQATIELGPHADVTASIGVGWLFTGIQYQQNFSDGFHGPKALVLYLRFPFGILWAP